MAIAISLHPIRFGWWT